MKKERKFLSIMISLFVLNCFMFMPTTAAAASLENIIEQYELKDKVSNFLLDVGKIVINNLSNMNADTPVHNSYQSKGSKELKDKIIVIDAGHGGHNPGAVKYGLREADNNLAVALKVEEMLKAKGAKVIMTRSSDISLASKTSPLRDELQARVNITNQHNADIFVSIHTNSNENEKVSGAMTFYYDDKSKKLADLIQQKMVDTTKATDKGTAYGNFLVLRNNEVPAVLVEMGFISNQTEALKLNEDSYRQDMAVGITNGIQSYFQNSI